jgi:hypothetical protein
VAIIIPPPDPDAPPPTDRTWVRAAWFFGIAFAAAGMTIGVAELLRGLLRWA